LRMEYLLLLHYLAPKPIHGFLYGFSAGAIPPASLPLQGGAS